ncbi:hypothetical protein [Pleionea sediminis]|uniref:hypothetical protein n=1 Tax=Pleionea sediminis TaxID=2569479 RepID=UPI001184DB08|nr:hypothetical protein [Pleionea sediminis]
MTTNEDNKRKYWLDRPENVTKIVWLLWALCFILVAVDFIYHKHPYFSFDGTFGFYPIFGFIAYCFIVFSAKLLRRFVKRDEDYYDE